jgi:Cd2+/Zn2+-exporting ATPase
MEQVYTVTGMDCAHCAETLQNGISRLDGVNAAKVDFVGGKLVVEGDINLATLQQRAGSLGNYTLTPPDAPTTSEEPLRGDLIGFGLYLLRETPTRFALTGGAFTLIGVLLASLGLLQAPYTTLTYIVATAIAAYPIARSGVNNLFINRNFNLNLLMTIAAVGAVVIGETVEAAVVIFLYAVGEALEGFTADRARQSIRSLADVAPATAVRRNGEILIEVPVESLVVGDVILVRPSERIPMDGEIVSGQTSVNQAAITGESMPVARSVGDGVYAGSLNGDGAVDVRVTQVVADNTLNRMIQLVEQAQSVRAPSQRRIDQFAAYYTPAMTIAALLVATVPPLVFGAPFLETDTGHGWLYRALAMLMIACPCSLVISTPVTVVSAITTAARRGVLIKGGLHLETLGRVTAVAFDKTGTLTHGEPTVTSYHALHGDANAVLNVAAAVEQASTHPLARAIVTAATESGHAQGVVNMAGDGVRGVVNGQRVIVGSHRYFDAHLPHDKTVCEQVAEAERNGQTTVLVAQDEQVTGVISVADTVRENSREVVDTLHTLGLSTHMLTGDNATVAEIVGGQVGVSAIHAELLPQHKSDWVRERAEVERVAMVGDGVNDTPALAAASVGIAMGGAGSAQAIETADIVLMADDISALPFTVRLSRFADRLIRQNIVLSVGVKLAFTVLAVAGLTSLWGAIFADVGMLVLVTLNGMRPLRFQ